mgnify:CR=1 FL=1
MYRCYGGLWAVLLILVLVVGQGHAVDGIAVGVGNGDKYITYYGRQHGALWRYDKIGRASCRERVCHRV